jgi:hypothetical protein
MPGAHAHGLQKNAAEVLNPDETAKHDELALRKMMRASACKNVRLNECMVRRPGSRDVMLQIGNAHMHCRGVAVLEI